MELYVLNTKMDCTSVRGSFCVFTRSETEEQPNVYEATMHPAEGVGVADTASWITSPIRMYFLRLDGGSC